MAKNKKYDKAAVESALHAIRNGLSYIKASVQFKVPKTTIIEKNKKKYSHDKPGAPTILTPKEENHLVQWIVTLGKAGFPVTKTQLIESVTELLKTLDRENPFKDGVPGRHWYKGFLKRHKEISCRVSQNLTKARADVTEIGICDWFQRVQNYVDENQIQAIIEDPTRIFNCDETAFFLAPKENRVLVPKSMKKVYARIANDEKDNLTVLLSVRADGVIAAPLVIFPYKRMPTNIKLKYPKGCGWGLGQSDSGWMTSETFYEYITNVLHPWLKNNKVQMPVVLYLDGHSSHLSLPVIEFCKDVGIILIALLPNSTHTLQPLDVGLFKSLKQSWKECVRTWKMKNDSRKLDREDFATVLKICLEKFNSQSLAENAFRKCGLHPFNADNVDYSLILDKKISTVSPASNSNESSIVCTCDKNNQFLKEFEERLDPEILQQFTSTIHCQ